MEIPQGRNPNVRVIECASTEASDARKLWNFNALASPFWRLYWTPLEWHCKVVLNGKTTWLDPRSLVLIPPETPFDARCETALRQFNIHFTAAFPWSAVRPAVFKIKADAVELSMIKEISAICRAGRDADFARLGLLCTALCLLGLAGIEREAVPKSPLDSRVVDSLRVVNNDFRKKLTTSALAKRAGMNVNAFIRLFKAETGATPQKILVRRRIDNAASLLDSTEKTLEEIAELCGFCDRRHLSKCFSALRGCGPAAWRRARSNETQAQERSSLEDLRIPEP